MSEVHTLTVTAASRVDLFVGEQLKLSRAKLKALFEDARVKVNGRTAKKGLTVEPGQTVTVDLPEEGPRAPAADAAMGLEVLHEDESLIFVNKPAGIPVHPLLPGELGTVANALVARYPEVVSAGADEREAGLCHRLDVETSGVLLVARNRAAWDAMREAFSAREGVDKQYVALVTGPLIDEGEIEISLLHHHDRVRPDLSGGPDAREALSRFEVRARSGEYSLVDVKILTGVLHQVRAHLAAIGAPIVGDTHYGGRPLEGLARFFLHARSLGVFHPVTKQLLTVESPLPEELRATLLKVGFTAS